MPPTAPPSADSCLPSQCTAATLPSSTRALRRMLLLLLPLLLLLLLAALPAAADELPNPQARPFTVGELLHRWDFNDGSQGWRADHDCRIGASDGLLDIESTGGDPYLSAPIAVRGSRLAVRIRMRLETHGQGQFFWSSTRHRGMSAGRQAAFDLIHDGGWHEYTVPLPIEGDLTTLRLDPGTGAGKIQVDWIAVHRGEHHPLEITRLEPQADRVHVHVRNHGDRPLAAQINGQPLELAAGDVTRAVVALPSGGPLLSGRIEVAAPGLPPLERQFWTYREGLEVASVERRLGDLSLYVARDGSLARLARGGSDVAVLAPIVHRDGCLPELELVEPGETRSGHLEAGSGSPKPVTLAASPLVFAGDGVRLTLGEAAGGLLEVRVESQQPVEGPVVRVFGNLEQGLLAGVEYLGRGEHSSSRLDIETDEHLRVEPDPMDVTMPLMALVTDRSSVALAWDDHSLQPVFAVPDFVDYGPGHRMALKGKRIQAVIRVADGWAAGGRLEDAILWAVRRAGLPPLPPVPRSLDEQMQLSLAAYQGLILDHEHGGWFHAVVPGSRRMPDRGAPLADCASAIFRITGQMPEVDRLQLGGAHIRNSASYFVSGRAADWLRTVNAQGAQLRAAQLPDGSYRYDGPYRRGHFENTASGVCARPAYLLLEHAHFTGDPESLAAGLKALEFIQRFRTPRGAQTWEVPLHTPDILASAHLVWAFVRAYELTGDAAHLAQARRWALTGLPFVYQWSNQPIMRYATIAVYGATNWQAPNWIGLPVQWCGTVYAYALLLLAPHDQTLDWAQLAEGILICGEQMQYPEGPSRGCLPDVFALAAQQRLPADINPGALVSLRLRIAGRLEDLAVASDGDHRIVAPYPVRLDGGQAVIQAVAGQRYQVLIEGRRVVEIESQGEDRIDLFPEAAADP